ncbi:hypothetical protein [Larkinella sp. C7]|jgi:hypothetical protein|uniref:hypothetical protein n=1 Tax=Larkinella sp. C7 TaxID=2576607 RepID=UPI001110FB81|nr:hypothetical protein [Larkinella sp. C7]
MRYWILFTVFLLSLGIVDKTRAQAEFSEGTLIYRIDTVRRLELHPSSYLPVQFKLYKKADLIRVETQYVNMADSTDRKRMIEIRNQKGIYSVLEEKPSIPIDSLVKKLSMSKDSLLKVFPWMNEFALFSSYEEEKISRSTAALQGRLKTYTAKKVGQKSSLLSMPTEKFVLTSLDKSDSLNIQVTQAISAPVGLFFEPLRKIAGTPLQFTDSQYGWHYRYTIESVKAQSLPDELFQIDPKLRILTDEQMLQETKELIK